MTYISWIAIVEGETDRSYFDVLLPRIMENIALQRGTRNITIAPIPVARLSGGREVDRAALAACELIEATYIVFVHADTGGRALEAGIASRGQAYCHRVGELCDWPPERCVVISPRHETEAWALADPSAVMSALGYRGRPADIGLPMTTAEAERLTDPKRTLSDAFENVRRRRTAHRVSQLLPSIAQSQSITALRGSQSFQAFEESLCRAMASLGCLDLDVRR